MLVFSFYSIESLYSYRNIQIPWYINHEMIFSIFAKGMVFKVFKLCL